MRRETILRASGKTHLSVTLCKNGKTKRLSVHRLVAETFVPNPEGKPVVDHIDTNPKNNSVDNLRWVTTQENCMNPLTRINNSKSKMGHKCYLKQHSEETKQKYLDKIADLPYFCYVENSKGKTYFLSHAGFTPDKNLFDINKLKNSIVAMLFQIYLLYEN